MTKFREKRAPFVAVVPLLLHLNESECNAVRRKLENMAAEWTTGGGGGGSQTYALRKKIKCLVC